MEPNQSITSARDLAVAAASTRSGVAVNTVTGVRGFWGFLAQHSGVTTRLVILLLGLAAVKLALIGSLGKHLYELHWRDSLRPATAVNHAAFYLFVSLGVLSLLQLGRRRCREVESSGGTWHQPFDLLRDAVWQIWPSISAEEKRRFMRHLRPWYDTHRFRIAPPIERIVMAAEARGAVVFHAARTVSVAAEGARLAVGLQDRGANLVRTETYDAVINCTGTVAGPGDDPLSVALQAGGMTRPHPSGLGWDVDDDCRAVRGDGSPHRRLFVVGPPTAGVFGDPFGAPWITAQISRMIPGVRALFT